MKLLPVLMAVLVVATLVPTTVVGTKNESPLPEAGLDQTVHRGSRVLLDATGSRDPDGRIVSYHWNISTRDGRNVTPSSPTSARTGFLARKRGRYTVTLTVTDDDGATSVDKLFVTVERGEAPTVLLRGPKHPTAGTQQTYTASLSRGAAPLRTIVWRVGDFVVERQELSDGQQTATLNTAFGSTDETTVNATLSDSDGLSDSAEVRVRPEAMSTGSDPRSPSSGQSTLATRSNPSISGERTVTGERPLRATYSLESVSSNRIRSVRWISERGAIGHGRTASTEWEPGTHNLFAVVTYRDGSHDIAHFSDGGTEVIADPKPQVRFQNLEANNTLTGDALGTDAFGNLESVRVAIDGETITRWPWSIVRERNPRVKRHRLSFSQNGLSFDRSYSVTITATDARGQRTAVTKTVQPTGTPEIVESGFVNTPVDSYDERIAQERYVAKHVTKIDLNGVKSARVSLGYIRNKGNVVTRVGRLNRKRVYKINDDLLVVTTYWKAKIPGNFTIKSVLKRDGEAISSNEDRLHVKNSPPELRMTIIFDGTPHWKQKWGAVADAGSSFDPDGTDLKYIWGKGAKPIGPDNSTGKFNSNKLANLTIIDEDGLKTKQEGFFFKYLVPPVTNITSTKGKPYRPNETVRLKVRTRSYQLTKNRYHLHLGIKVQGVHAHIESWTEVVEQTRGTASDVKHWEGVIEIPSDEARQLEEGRVKIYNKDNPGRNLQYHSLPDITVLTQASDVRRNITVDNLRYVVRTTNTDRRRVKSTSKRLDLMQRGYEVVNKVQTGSEQVIEKRVKVQNARYETKRRVFRHTGTRRQLLEMSQDWSSGGSEQRVKTWTSTDSVWRNHRTGSGEYTGETRQKKVHDARYRLKKKYRYTREVTKVGYRTEWERRTRTVEKESTKRVRVCSFYRCYYTERTVTHEVERTYYVRDTERYTYTDTETETYWAYGKHGSDHHYTGEHKRVKVEDAEYTTQYQFDVEKTHRKRYRVYFATKEVQVAPPEYEWHRVGTTDNRLDAYQRTRKDGYRIGESSVTYAWILSKQFESSKVISKCLADTSNVTQTRAEVSGENIERLFNPKNGTFVATGRSKFHTKFTFGRYMSEMRVIRQIKTKPDENCQNLSTEGESCK